MRLAADRQLEDADQLVQLPVPWVVLEHFLKSRGASSTPRLSYDRGVLQLMSPSEVHESVSRLVTLLLHTWALENGVELRAVGSWTLKRKAALAAVEPDECFIVGRHNPRVPDLAVEIVWKHAGLDKLPLYARLGVPEVWFWEKGVLQVFVRKGQGFSRSLKSVVLPGINLRLIADLCSMKSQVQAVRLLREHLRAH